MAKKIIPKQLSLFEKIEYFFERNPKVLMYVPLILTLIFGILLFNLRLDEGGDDSAYINRASDFLQDGKFPSFQGPIYPLFLSTLIIIFGIKLPLLKLTSLVFMILSFFFLTKALKGRIPHLVLFLTLILLSINAYVLHFASQTYSEALFMMLQAIFFWRFFRYYDKFPSAEIDVKSPIGKKEIIELAILGLLLFLAFQTRTIGATLIVATLTILGLKKKFKQIGILVGILILSYGGIKGIEEIFHKKGEVSASQMSTLTYKHPYNLAEGKEDVSGYFMRIVDNSNLYIGKQFLKIIGVKDSTNKEYSVLFTVLFYIFLGLAFYQLFRKSTYALFLFVYLVLFLLGTFVSIQKIWDQYRLIIPVVPIIFMFTTLYFTHLLSQKGFHVLQPVLLFAFGVSALFITINSTKKFETQNLLANLTTNKYQGYTPDWENFLKLSEEYALSLPPNSLIAVRKPDMARIYANGKKFYGIYRFNSEDADELVKQLKEAKVTHMLLASLRKNPEVNSGEVINTLHRYMGIIIKKYPQAFTELKVVGGQEEPAAIYQINYQYTSQK